MPPYPGNPIKRNDSGPNVAAIQKALGVQQTALFGPTTEENVCRFQRGHGLTADGVVGPLTWAQLFSAPAAGTGGLAQKALQIAQGYVGQQEHPLGSNRGPFVDQCNQMAGVPLGSFWCMSFVHRCVVEAAQSLGLGHTPMPQTASCSFLYNWALGQHRLVSHPQPGDIFLCIGNQHGAMGHYHTGFVAAAPDGNEHFQTIEGNSNDDGSSNGIAVVHRTPGRGLSSCHYVRL